MNIHKDFEAQQKNLSNMLVRTLAFLYEKGKTGNWGDIRGHSLAMWALIDCGENPDSPLIQAAKDWLFRHIRKENKGMSWESEVWDTALSIIALLKSKVKPYDYRISKARKWLLSLRNNDWNWHYEPWETSLALLAYLAYLESFLNSKNTEGSFLRCRIVEEQLNWISKSIDWLIGLQEKGDTNSEIKGQLISFHYTAFLILILGKLKGIYTELERISTRLKKISTERYEFIKTKYQNNITLASNFLINHVKEKIKKRENKGVKEKDIWTKEFWSNGYILLALTKYCEETSFDFRDEKLNSEIILWIKENEKNILSGADIEDTALAVLGTWSLFLERQIDSIKDESKNEETIRNGCKFDVFQKFTSLVSKKKLALRKKMIRVNPDGSIEVFISKENKKIFMGIMSAIALLLGWIAAGKEIISFVQKAISAFFKVF